MDDAALFTRSTCSALLITCSDFRFKRAERTFTEQAGLSDDYDLIARPGAIRALVAPRDEASRQTLHDEIALLHRLHGFTRILMLNHSSCRAYDDLVAGGEERAIHFAHLAAAGKTLAQSFPESTPEAWFVAMDGTELRVMPVVPPGGAGVRAAQGR